MISLRWLLSVSECLAAFSLLVPSSLFFLRRFDWFDVSLHRASYCALASLLLLIVGVSMHRRRGLWLAIPVVIAFAFPVYFAVSWGLAIQACEQRHAGSMCVL